MDRRRANAPVFSNESWGQLQRRRPSSPPLLLGVAPNRLLAARRRTHPAGHRSDSTADPTRDEARRAQGPATARRKRTNNLILDFDFRLDSRRLAQIPNQKASRRDWTTTDVPILDWGGLVWLEVLKPESKRVMPTLEQKCVVAPESLV